MAELPFLGTGIGYRSQLHTDLFLHRSEVPVLEIVADHFLAPNAETRDNLALLKAHFTLIPHAIGLSLGSADGIDSAYVEALSELIDFVKPPWWSEHIAFTRIGSTNIGHLTPLPFTHEAVDILAQNVAVVKNQIKAPLILENIATTFSLPGEMDEPEFITNIIKATQCGLLLDVTNLHVNACNGGYDAQDALQRFPLADVVQLHFTGGHRRDDLEIDSHSYPTPEPVWDLLAGVAEQTAVRAAILERDHNFPPIADLLHEVERANRCLAAIST